MNRREFLKSSAAITIWPLINSSWRELHIPNALSDRMAQWILNPDTGVEWRYIAGRIIDGAQDFGFVVSISKVRAFGLKSEQCLVQRQNFGDDKKFVSKTYVGQLTYDSTSATYIFETDQELIRWQWDETAQVYNLSVTTPELTLDNLVLRPKGSLIAEGGDGDIRVGKVGGIPVGSNYHADWTQIEINNVAKGVARVDMQGLYRLAPTFSGVGRAIIGSDYDHQWFVLAAELNDGSPAWVSAWKIEDADGPFWGVTIALGSETTWQVTSVTEESVMVAPFQIETLGWQSLPPTTGLAQNAALKWHLTAGQSQPDDILNLQLTVPSGQFVNGDNQTSSDWLQEAIGIEAEGTILGRSISSTKLVAAESSIEYPVNFLPMIFK